MQSGRFSSYTRMLLLFLVICLAGFTAFAKNRPLTASISSNGKVMVNGSQVQPNSTLVSGSQISTMDNSSAVVSLGPLGQVFLNASSSIAINFDDTGVKVELKSGSVRVQKSGTTNAEVITNNCNNVEVMNGKVAIDSQDKKVSTGNNDMMLETGQAKDLQTKGRTASHSVTNDIDYKVSIIDCDLAGAAKSARSIRRGVMYAGAAAGGAAAIVTPIVKNGDSTSTSVSVSRP